MKIESSVPRTVTARGRALRLLLVDDDPAYRTILVRLLRQSAWAEYDLSLVADAERALAIDPDGYDAVLLDYQLGSHTGLDVLRAWRARGVATPVIMLTAMGGHATDVAAAEEGAYEYLDKADLDCRLLERAIRYSLALAGAMRTTRQALQMQSAVARAARALLEARGPDAVAAQVVRAVVLELGASAASLGEPLPDGTVSWIAGYPDTWRDAAARLARPGVMAGDDFALRALRARTPIVSDTVTDASASVEEAGRLQLSCVAAFPLVAPDRLSGVLQVYSTDPGFFTPSVLDAVSTYSSQAALAIRAARLQVEYQHAQKMEAIGQLAGGVAHDFNNLLTAIIGYASVLGDGPLQPDQRTSVDEIRSAAARAAGVTQQLLAFGRRQVLTPEVLDLNEVVSSVETLLRRLIGEHVHLVPVLDGVNATARVDRSQVEQMLINLAVNARDAMPAGGTLVLATRVLEIRQPRAAVASEIPPGRYVEVSVTDTGHGMDAATKQRAFEPFFTTKPVGTGTGLGLPTVLGSVQQSGGQITVESAPGRGTSVTLFFPWSAPDAAPVARPAAPPPAPAVGKGTILVAEDQDPVRALLCRVLLRAGFTVLEARDGEEALARLAETPAIALVVSDIVMPKVGGRALVATMRKRGHRARVLLVSGYTQEQESAHEPLPPEVGFLMKPFTPDALTTRVRELLNG